MVNQYELMIIFTPILSDDDLQKEIKKYKDYIRERGGEIVAEETWGLRQLAYPIQKKTTGIYYIVEFRLDTAHIARLETLMGRDDHIMREMITRLDKYAIEYNENRRKKLAEAKKDEKTADKVEEEA